MELRETVIDAEQVHYAYFGNVAQHVAELGSTYQAQKAGTPATAGLSSQGLVARAAAANAGG
jgi:bacterioferritin